VRRETAIAVAVFAIAVGAMAIDHLIGTESAPGETGLADPETFLISVGLALALMVVLFGVVIRRATRDEPENAALKAVAYSVLAVVTIPLLFIAVPFPLAGAGIALGLIARDSPSRRLAIAAVVVGVLVLVLGAGAYLAALLA
jgi:hypothetical protein